MLSACSLNYKLNICWLLFYLFLKSPSRIIYALRKTPVVDEAGVPWKSPQWMLDLRGAGSPGMGVGDG